MEQLGNTDAELKKSVANKKKQTYRVQSATLLERELITDTFWSMYRKLIILKKSSKDATLQYAALNFIKKTGLM